MLAVHRALSSLITQNIQGNADVPRKNNHQLRVHLQAVLSSKELFE